MAEIDLGMYVLAAKGDAGDILEAKPPEETLTGLYMAEMCREKGRLGGEGGAVNLLQLTIDYEDGVIIPQIVKDACGDTPLKLDGTVTIVAPSNFKMF
jgi:hypothetical protein